MENLNEENTQTITTQKSRQQEPFKTFENQSELDNFIKIREEKLKSKLETEIKSKLQKEAELSAEEKLNERIKDLENEKKSVLIDKNRTKAEREFVSKGFNSENYNEILDFIVSENEEITLEKTRKLLDFIELNSKKIADEKIKKAMKDVAKPENSEMKNQNKNEEVAEKLGKLNAQTYKTAQETLKKYL